MIVNKIFLRLSNLLEGLNIFKINNFDLLSKVYQNYERVEVQVWYSGFFSFNVLSLREWTPIPLQDLKLKLDLSALNRGKDNSQYHPHLDDHILFRPNLRL